MNTFHQTILPLFHQSRADWLAQARRTAYLIANSSGTITTDDIHKHCPIPDGIDPRVMGAVFAGHKWRKIGYVQSTRKACHSRPIGVFQLA